MAQANKWIDISVTIKAGMVHWPGDEPVRIKHIHKISKGGKNNLSAISMGCHTGTHIDAPLHFIARGAGINRMPFDATVGPARVFEIKDKRINTIEELLPYRIKKGERIILKTSNSLLWKNDKFVKNFVYIPGPTAEYIAAIGIRCIGVDYLSVGGFHKDGSITHKILLRAGIWIIEGLNLSNVRPGNYDLICLPLKILDSDGAPARAIIKQRRNKSQQDRF